MHSIAHEDAELRASRRRSRLQRQLLAALTALTLIAALLTVYAFRQRAAANHQRDLAVSRQVATTANEIRTTDVSLAAQLALAAYRIAPTAEARSSLLQSFGGPTATRVSARPGVIQALAISSDGTTMAAGAGDFSLHLWNLTHLGRPVHLGAPLSGHPNTIFSAAFSPDGTTLATGGGDKTLRLWKTVPGRPATPLGNLSGPGNTIYSVAFSPDGGTLAAGAADQTVRLWDINDPDRPTPLGAPLTGPAKKVLSVVFGPDGRTLAAAN